MVIRMFPGPFAGWLGALMFLLVMQFLIRYMYLLVGRGLPVTAVVELIAYSLAYMLVLAVPMSVLIATLMTYGRLAETGAYAVIKTAGVSLAQLIWPSLGIGILITGIMWHFNSVVLPEANYRAKTLWGDIRDKKPGFELEPGVFYEGIDDYSILVKSIDRETNRLSDIIIYDYSEGSRRRAEIKAVAGRLTTSEDGNELELLLEDGELHRLVSERSGSDRTEKYERLEFERYLFRLDLSDLAFRRRDPDGERRSDRTMRSSEMQLIVDSLRANSRKTREELAAKTLRLGDATEEETDSPGGVPIPATSPPVSPVSLVASRAPELATQETSGVVEGIRHFEGIDPGRVRAVYNRAIQSARLVRSHIDNSKRTLQWQKQRADRFAVEIHKKYSIAVACFIFVLVGAPLGLSIRGGSLGRSAIVSVAILLFYWITLVQGEKLADRGLLEPWIGMWGANIVTGLGAIWLFAYVYLDLRATTTLIRRLIRRQPA
ncbi:MAG: LptF/LptG family permease [Rhodothermia bacterium]|nr:LptF/LptG family permease [Rhodothermia bacterium]